MAVSYSRSHLSDQTLLRNLGARVARECTSTAELLADIAEVDARKLYLPAGFPSMFAYCTGELHLSEESARKRIHAARAARRVPLLFPAIADGRLHLSAVILLAPYLSQENAEELLAAATHKTKFQIEQLIAERFPRLDVPAMVEPLVESTSQDPFQIERAPGRVEAIALKTVEPAALRPKVTPLAPKRFFLQFTVEEETHDMLGYVQALLSHQVPPGDVARVFHLGLKSLIAQVEKRKFAATARPRRSRRHEVPGSRYISAAVKRAVWERDGGRCSFVSETGRRCPAHTLLEFDHLEPVARGGEATVDRIRLRCRAHNQYAAECAFGTEFMKRKRQEAQARAAAKTWEAANARQAKARAQAAQAEQSHEWDLISGLRWLGFRADEARRATALCENIPNAPLEQQMRVALSYFAPRKPMHVQATSQ
jgi:hypothetical protein